VRRPGTKESAKPDPRIDLHAQLRVLYGLHERFVGAMEARKTGEALLPPVRLRTRAIVGNSNRILEALYDAGALPRPVEKRPGAPGGGRATAEEEAALAEALEPLALEKRILDSLRKLSVQVASRPRAVPRLAAHAPLGVHV
jgi:hypothetical protein